jgi:hypothetical protein
VRAATVAAGQHAPGGPRLGAPGEANARLTGVFAFSGLQERSSSDTIVS